MPPRRRGGSAVPEADGSAHAPPSLPTLHVGLHLWVVRVAECLAGRTTRCSAIALDQALGGPATVTCVWSQTQARSHQRALQLTLQLDELERQAGT